MRRRDLLQGTVAVAGLGLLAGRGPVSFPSQRSGGLRRIGFLESGSNPTAFEALRAGLRDLGYVEGQNLLIEYRDAELNAERLPALAAELVSAPVELMVVSNTPSAFAATQATSAILIVAAGGNVVAAGLVTNIARPEGNLTGVTTNSLEAIGKWIELLKETVPAIARLGVVLDLSSSASQPRFEQVQRAAQTLQLQLAPYDLRELDHLPAVLSTAKADRADGPAVVSGGVIGGGMHPRIGGDVLKSRLPAVAENRAFARNGGLLAHGPDTVALARRSASYVDKILKGTKPADLPIEQPTKFDLVVNLKTAQALGLQIPESILTQATEVIQ